MRKTACLVLAATLTVVAARCSTCVTNILASADDPTHPASVVEAPHEKSYREARVRYEQTNTPSPSGRTVDRPITNAKCAFAIYTEDWGLASRGGPTLIVAIFEDGTAVWSVDQVHGGPPYRKGGLPPQALERHLARLKEAGFFTDTKLRRAHVPWDSQFTTIFAKMPRRKAHMRSDHELAVVGEYNEVPDALHFHGVWDDIRRWTAEVLPKDSVAVEGELISDRGVIRWRESPTPPAATT